MISKTDRTDYVRDMNSNAILACDKKMLLNHRKKLNDSKEINIMRSEISELKNQMNQIITLLKNKE